MAVPIRPCSECGESFEPGYEAQTICVQCAASEQEPKEEYLNIDDDLEQ
jgi:hypothetical protein